MLNQLRKINQNLMVKYQLEKQEDKLLKQQVIGQILQNDNCFFEMSIEIAYSILTDLGYKKEELKQVYLELTKPKK